MEVEEIPGHRTPRPPPSPPHSISRSPPRPPSSPPPRSPSPPPLPNSDESDSEDRNRQSTLAEGEFPPATIPKIRIALEFIELVKAATLVSQFSPQELADFLNPEEHESASPDDPNFRFSLLNFISLMSSSQDTYKAVHQNG